MTTIVTRAGKTTALTWDEADANFTNLNNNKVEESELSSSTGSSMVGYLASGAGSLMVGHGVQTVEGALNERLPEIGTYALLRAYTGPVTAFFVRGVANIFDGGFGPFRVDAADTTSADNGGTILVDAIGRRWKRDYSVTLKAEWFVGDAANATAGLLKLFNYAIPLALPFVLKGNYTVSGPLS